MKIISVVIIVRNEEKRIQLCLQSLLSQKSIEKIEIVVVDGASTDNTICVVKKLATMHPFIKIICCSFYGYSIQRNIGANAATGKYILYISGDTIVAPNLIERYIRAANQGFDIVQGSVINVPDNSKFSQLMVKIYPLFYMPYLHTAYEQFSTVNVLIRRQMILEKPFDEKLFSLEDKEWCYRNIQSAKYQRLKGAIIFHTVHETLTVYCAKVHKEAVAVGQISHKRYNGRKSDMNIFNWVNWAKRSFVLIIFVLLIVSGYIFLEKFIWIPIVPVIFLPICPAINTAHITNNLPKKYRIFGSLIIYLFFWMVVVGVIRGYISEKFKNEREVKL